MATLSSPGIGSGLDVKSLVNQLVELEKRPLAAVQLRTAAAQTRLSVVGQIKGQLAALDDALAKLQLESTYTAMRVSSSSPAVSGTAAFTALGGSYTVQVNQLARGQVVQSAALSGPVGSGTMTIQMGEWQTGPVFAPGSAPGITVNVSAGDTLADIATKINNATSDVKASVINDGGGQRLVLRSASTGVTQGFRIQVSDGDGNDTDNNGLSRLAYDPAAGTFGLTLTQTAQNTLASVDGISVSSTDRTLANVIPGVTLTVNEVTSQPVTVEVGRDSGVTRKAIEAFVEAYNQLNKTLTEAVRYDPQSRQAGPLQGDTTIVTLQAALRRLIAADGPGPADLQRWSDLGVQMARDGSLTINSSKLDTALQQPAVLKELLSSDGPVKGLARQLRDFTSGAVASNGRMTLKTKAVEAEIRRLNEQAQRINEKASRTEQRLLAQYSRLDSTLSQLSALNSYVTQQVAQWNKKSG